MPPKVDVRVGDRFGQRTVIGDVVHVGRDRMYPCRCDCGRVDLVRPSPLVRLKAPRCNTCADATRPTKRTRHGEATKRAPRSPEYVIWKGMINRCSTPTAGGFHNYGGRGIRVCEEWCGPGGFERFIAHIGRRPSPDLSVDRIDVNGHYEPGNVRWATRSEQARNRRPGLQRRRSHPSDSTPAAPIALTASEAAR